MSKKIIALLGQPNAGKTTLFNQLTGLNQKIVNYPGSTVDIATGRMEGSQDITLLDLPGITSLEAQSEDEEIALKGIYQLNQLMPEEKEQPDLIMYCLDQTQRSRHLSVIKQCLEAKMRLIVVLTMTDLAEKKKKQLDTQILENELGCPVVAVNAKKNKNIETLKNICKKTKSDKKESHKIITLDPHRLRLNYEWAEEMVKKAQQSSPQHHKTWDLDQLFLNPFFGPITFLGIMALFFTSIFTLAAPLMEGIDIGFGFLSTKIVQLWPQHVVSHWIAEGLVTGLAGIFVFVPQIAILFLGMGLLESTGYLARAAVIIDKPLSKVGLSGRSFLPLLSGCACAIPAMLAARNISSKWEKKICLFIIPLMQCSARLPVYGLLLGLLFKGKPWLSGLGLMLIYLSSVILACLIASFLSRRIKKETVFQIELPQWRYPDIGQIIRNSLQKTSSFIINAGPIILAISIVLWGISVYPSEQESYALIIGQWMTPVWAPMGVDWRVGLAILLSFAAREVFVSVLAVVFAIESQAGTLLDMLRNATVYGSTNVMFTTPVIIGLTIFFMIALQCGATVSVARKEMGNWKDPLIQLISYGVLAYGLAVLVQVIFGAI